MIDELKTLAEKRAEKAEDLPAFSGIKLLHIKRALAELLKLIGRDGIFDEYTAHDISHIDEMLKALEWLIPDQTMSIMTPSDWLLTVLAIYFHDLGMLVTREEYERRMESGFPEYRDKTLFSGDQGKDYSTKIGELPPFKAERFLYQEFVRHMHAERIRDWIMGRASVHLGTSNTVVSEINSLLNPLDIQFRRDLALICESHHLNDLNDFKKYKISQPYGNSDDETVNLQYAAILLRTTDLLHITSDRTPSIAFRTINPIDPLSQEEWAKQMAVKRVRSKVALDREGNIDSSAPRDTIEIYAYFNHESGFFGLTSYLLYAQDQLRRSYEWAQEANKQHGARHVFPWRYIDDSNIETEGFLKETFEFTIDQAKILDLLTGHTLYNDTSVVLRELAQNSLDAIRLQAFIDALSGNPTTPGELHIHWDSRERVLSVRDNGTGMTQLIIERHLLKVGASRYQDPEFRRLYPTFSAISRFGIGLLSTFMIADSVEILSCHPDEDYARQLSLRSVHGKYLIRLLDKQTHPAIKTLVPHGTVITLKVRPSAAIKDIRKIAKKWIVVPGCRTTFTQDNEPPESIGFSSLTEALENELRAAKLLDSDQQERRTPLKIRIEEKTIDGVTVAYALQWSEYFQEWNFLKADRESIKEIQLGICIEGVRIDFNSPGYNGMHVLALANAHGSNAPKTNVARSGLEMTPERDLMFSKIYSIYCDHIKNEIRQLQQDRGFSLTWATQEGGYILGSLIPSKPSGDPKEVELTNTEKMFQAAKKIPLLLVEQDGKRVAKSPYELADEEIIWTIDSAFFRSAEWLIREIAGPVSLSDLINAFQINYVSFPTEPLICGATPRDKIHQFAFMEKEIDQIGVYPEQRRIDLRWVKQTDPPRWRELNLAKYLHTRAFITPFYSLDVYTGLTFLNMESSFRVGIKGIKVLAPISGCAVRSYGTTYVLPDSKLAQYLLYLDGCATEFQDPLDYEAIAGVIGLLICLIGKRKKIFRSDSDVKKALELTNKELAESGADLGAHINLDQLWDVIENTSWERFDTSAWKRKGEGEGF